MSTVTDKPASKPANGQQNSLAVKQWEFLPFMAKEPITLSIGIVRSFVANPTRSGQLPHDREIVKFIMLCKARGLNPFEGDAYLVGYDSKNGPSFSLITAHQAFIKRAEVHPEFDGMRSGAIVVDKEGNICERKGSFILDTDKLVGGWATVYFKTRKHPCEKTVKLKTYDTGRSRWEADPSGMIVKVAEAAALRSAFPSQFGGMYLEGEIADEDAIEVEHTTPAKQEPPASLDALADRLMAEPPAPQQSQDSEPADDADQSETGPDWAGIKRAFAKADTEDAIGALYEECLSYSPTPDQGKQIEAWRVEAMARVCGGKGKPKQKELADDGTR